MKDYPHKFFWAVVFVLSEHSANKETVTLTEGDEVAGEGGGGSDGGGGAVSSAADAELPRASIQFERIKKGQGKENSVYFFLQAYKAVFHGGRNKSIKIVPATQTDTDGKPTTRILRVQTHALIRDRDEDGSLDKSWLVVVSCGPAWRRFVLLNSCLVTM